MNQSIPIWAGIECTVNRVGDNYINQCEKNGHLERIQDLELIAQLGISHVRYPFLWEFVAPDSIEKQDWSWTDERLQEFQRLDLKPIAGFLHHGSGPKYTSLLDPEFPDKFEYYARQFSLRYPWVTDFTPINEPLTTARFSGLYGVWYPHLRSDESFLRALYHQIKGIVLAMKAIREINPNARLIQTEDIGRAQGTKPLGYQVNFENERRWLSFDLLCGRVDKSHKLYKYLVFHGLQKKELDFLVENPCPPDVLGLNHYLLSNRFLDHRLEYYPPDLHGTNGRHQYADVGVVDTTAADLPTPESIFREVWKRYNLPIAVTEVHLNGPREAQIQWIHEISQALKTLKREGVDVRALTIWSLLGSFDWNTLCTVCNDFYEPGAFDVRAPSPRPTAITKVIKNLANGHEIGNSLFESEGWWKRKDQARFGPKLRKLKVKNKISAGETPVLITGANGTLGKAFIQICNYRNIPFVAVTRNEMDITSLESVRQVIGSLKPWAVVNTAGYVRVDDAEGDKARCFLANIHGPRNLAQVCAQNNISFLHYSSDLVFDGRLTKPYTERMEVAPVNIYGTSKAASEKQVLEVHPGSLVVRTSSFFGPWDQHNFVFSALRSLACGNRFQAASDITFSPTYVPDLVHASLDLLIDGLTGIVHLTNDGHLTWAELAHKAAQISMQKKSPFNSKLWSTEHLISVPSDQMKFVARRPLFSALKSERLHILPAYDDALERYFNDLKIPYDRPLEFFPGSFQETLYEKS